MTSGSYKLAIMIICCVVEPGCSVHYI